MSNEKLRTFLLWPFLPEDSRRRLRQQRRDEEATRRGMSMLAEDGVSVTLAKRVDSPQRAGVHAEAAGSRASILWDGSLLAMSGPTGRTARWPPVPGGLRRGFDAASVAAVGVRPVSPDGECPALVAAVAAVSLAGHHVHRIYFLDAESRELGWIPAERFTEEAVLRVARVAGVAYRHYVLALGKFSSLRVSPAGLCEGLFPRANARVALVSDESERVERWYTESSRSRSW